MEGDQGPETCKDAQRASWVVLCLHQLQQGCPAVYLTDFTLNTNSFT